MTGKKKILLIVIILLLGVAFIGIGFVLTQSTTSTTKTSAKTEEGTEQEKQTGMVGDKVAAEKLIDQTVTRDEIEEKVGEWNNFELDGAGCERGVYAGKFFYDNILINSRTYDKGETFRIVTVQDQQRGNI